MQALREELTFEEVRGIVVGKSGKLGGTYGLLLNQDHGKGRLSLRGVAVMTETAMTAKTAKTVKTATVASLCFVLYDK